MPEGDGIKTCATCGDDLSGDQIGYCQGCLDQQERLQDFVDTSIGRDLASMVDLQRYAQDKRDDIQNFISNPAYEIQWLTFEEAQSKCKETSVHAILSPNLAAVVDYYLVKTVSHIRPVNPSKIQYFVNYWWKQYEIELEGFSHEVGLHFESGSYHYGDWYSETRIYDYPDCLIETYLIRRRL